MMETDNKILGNQLVVMSREDFDNLVNEAAQNMVAAQTYALWNQGIRTLPFSSS